MISRRKTARVLFSCTEYGSVFRAGLFGFGSGCSVQSLITIYKMTFRNLSNLQLSGRRILSLSLSLCFSLSLSVSVSLSLSVSLLLSLSLCVSVSVSLSLSLSVSLSLSLSLCLCLSLSLLSLSLSVYIYIYIYIYICSSADRPGMLLGMLKLSARMEVNSSLRVCWTNE